MGGEVDKSGGDEWRSTDLKKRVQSQRVRDARRARRGTEKSEHQAPSELLVGLRCFVMQNGGAARDGRCCNGLTGPFALVAVDVGGRPAKRCIIALRSEVQRQGW